MHVTNIWHLLLLLAAALVWVYISRNRRIDHRTPRVRHGDELHPVFSAETERGTEAEFINERLPARFPLWWIALLMAGALAAYLIVR